MNVTTIVPQGTDNSNYATERVHADEVAHLQSIIAQKDALLTKAIEDKDFYYKKARELEASERTARRDAQAISDMFFQGNILTKRLSDLIIRLHEREDAVYISDPELDAYFREVAEILQRQSESAAKDGE